MRGWRPPAPAFAIVVVVCALVVVFGLASSDASTGLTVFIANTVIFGSMAFAIWRWGGAPGQLRQPGSLNSDLSKVGPLGYVGVVVGAALSLTEAWPVGQVFFFVGLVGAAIGHARRQSL